MTNPTIVGTVELRWPTRRPGQAQDAEGRLYAEQVRTVAFDTSGQAWGLVERLTHTGSAGEGRVDMLRWIRFEAIPFVPEEVLSSDGWKTGS